MFDLLLKLFFLLISSLICLLDLLYFAFVFANVFYDIIIHRFQRFQIESLECNSLQNEREAFKDLLLSNNRGW